MGFLNKLIKICSKGTTPVDSGNKLSQHIDTATTPIKVIHKNNLYIHPDLINLIWIGDGKYKNYQNNPEETIVYPYEGFKIKISMFGPDEPSLLYLKLPIKEPAFPNEVQRPPYYPFYRELTPEQKWMYWKFLSDPYNPSNDIGYVFIFYYGLERHLLYGNFDNAFELILKLRDVYNNKSFQMYSSSALILSAMIHKRPDCANKFIASLDKEYEFQIQGGLYFLCKFGLNMPIDAVDIMRFHKFFSFTNNRYIKNNADLFMSNLKKNIFIESNGSDVLYASNYFSKIDIAQLNYTSVPVFANVSIREKEITIPDISQSSKFTGRMFQILNKTHEDTKAELAAMRKGENNISKATPCITTPNLPIFDSSLLPYNISKELSSPENITQFFLDIDVINNYLAEARNLSKIRTKLCINKNDIIFSGIRDSSSHWEIVPYTKTGKLAKYPLVIHYRTKYFNSFEPIENYFGSIYYMKDGTIGKAELINWIKHKNYLVKLGIINGKLSIKSVQTLDDQYNRIYIYKHI